MPQPPQSRAAEARLRQAFRFFNHFMVGLWRLGLGRWVNAWPAVGGRILVLVHTGRKSARRRLTPLNYAQLDGDLYIVAGFGSTADWYRNLCRNPMVEVWLPRGRWQAVAGDIVEPAARLRALRAVLIASGFAARLAGLNPHTLSDTELARLTLHYQVVRLRRAAPVAGPGGPADLAWVWILAALALAAWLMLRRRTAPPRTTR